MTSCIKIYKLQNFFLSNLNLRSKHFQILREKCITLLLIVFLAELFYLIYELDDHGGGIVSQGDQLPNIPPKYRVLSLGGPAHQYTC